MHIEDINLRVNKINKDKIMDQELKEQEIKLNIEKKEKRVLFYKRNYKKNSGFCFNNSFWIVVSQY